jgi:pimeloyl-ACP methyl ester carboxylesterase
MKRIAAILMAIVVCLAAGVAGSYWWATRADRPFAPEMRASHSDQYATLSEGVVRYDWAGPEKGPVVVLVHGFSIPRFVFHRNVDALAQAGYRVLTYDHLGRGDSDRPPGPYNADFYDRELLGLLATLHINAPINLLGYSMGGGVAANFAGRHPEKVAKLMLVAPIGFMPAPALGPQLLRAPGIGEWLMAVGVGKKLSAAVQKDADLGLFTQDMANRFADQMADSNYRHALLSSMREFLYTDMGAQYRAWGQQQRPTLLLWGESDSTVPISGLAPAQAAIPHAKVITMPGVEHSLVYGNADAVNAYLLEFLGPK